ncbi:restriction endonuclease subunit S [Vibrio lentus]|uniref:restriction endonuclease subunit S n=1 Tax=Vibrio lentus TaxID=136468 RepID=UPI004063F2B6
MDAKQFIAEFGHIANAIGGVQRLRTLIIELAVQGKLVSNIALSNLTTDLLSEIARTKALLVSEKSLPREKPYPQICNKELPLERPDSWQWPRFGEVWQLVSGRDLTKSQYNENKVGIPYITGASNIEDGVININRWTDSPVVVSFENDLLITCKGTIGTLAFNTIGEIHIARQIMAIRDFSGLMNTAFLKIWLESYVIKLTEKSKSMIPGFSRNDLLHAVFPLPPLEEQAHIVEKVDELMALCDKLEEQQKQKRQLQNQLRQTTLQVLAEASSPFEIKQHWQRLQENFEKLFSTPEDVTDFKGLLLDLAVSGKLLSPEQYVKDATGSELLTDIEYLRVKWAENSFDQELKEAKTMLTKLRKQNVEAPTEKLPQHWQWATFLQVSMAVIDCHNKTAPYVEKGIHLVRTTDIRNGKMDLRNTKKITDETYDYWSRRMPPKPGDIFFTREAPVGEAAIVPKKEKVCLGQRTMLLRLFPEHINNEFLLYVIRSPSFQRRMVEAAVGMTVKHLRVGGVENLFVPVPPKSEQDLIVVILNHFFSLCEKLEQGLSNKNRVAENLASSSTAELTGINITQKEESLKVPKTELVAPVALGKNKPNSKDDAPLAALLARQNGQMNANDLWQRFGGEIGAFYAQLKVEVAHGWIAEPETANMIEKDEE